MLRDADGARGRDRGPAAHVSRRDAGGVVRSRSGLLVLLAVLLTGCASVSIGFHPKPAPIGDLACGIATSVALADPTGCAGLTALAICGASLLVDVSRAVEIRVAQTRVDRFDTHGNRTGYSEIYPSGTIVEYDKHWRRTGTGQIIDSKPLGVTDADRQRWREQELRDRIERLERERR